MKNNNLYILLLLINSFIYIPYFIIKTVCAYARACAHEVKELLTRKLFRSVDDQLAQKHFLTFYAHYCLDCQMMYFGTELNVVKPCIRCGSTKVLNGPQINSKERIGSVAD